MVGQNFVPSSGRPTALAAAVTVSQSHQVGSAQPIGMVVVLVQYQ